MNLLEILKANGIDDEIVAKVTADMKSNKVFTAGEENLDIRYGKLKNEHAVANQTIAELQAKIEQSSELATKVEALEKENASIRTDYAIDRALIEAKVQDVDYMKFKLKEKYTEGLKLDENGKIESLNTVLDDLKIQFPTQFSKGEKKIEEKKLDKTDDDKVGITKEQFNKMNYHERAKLFNEQPEQYAELNKGE